MSSVKYEKDTIELDGSVYEATKVDFDNVISTMGRFD